MKYGSLTFLFRGNLFTNIMLLLVWRRSYFWTWLKPEIHKKYPNLKLSKTISECRELMKSKLCMWWTNYNDNNYLFSCFYSNNYSTAAVFCWISICMQTPFSWTTHETQNNKYQSSFPYFLCNKFYGSQLQVQETVDYQDKDTHLNLNFNHLYRYLIFEYLS